MQGPCHGIFQGLQGLSIAWHGSFAKEISEDMVNLQHPHSEAVLDEHKIFQSKLKEFRVVLFGRILWDARKLLRCGPKVFGFNRVIHWFSVHDQMIPA